MRLDRVIRIARWAAATVLAAVCFGLLAGSSARAAGYVFGAVALVVMLIPYEQETLIRFTPALSLVAAGVMADYIESDPRGSVGVLVATGMLLVGTVALEPVVRFAATVPGPRSANVEGFEATSDPWLALEGVMFADVLLVVAAAVAALEGWSAATLLLCVLVVDVATVVVVGDRALRRRVRARERDAVVPVLAAWAPEFIVYFSGPDEASYQLRMWLPYLERVGRRFALVVRERPVFDDIRTATSVPVLLRSTIADLDATMVPSIKAVLYVNNGMKNVHSVRFSELTHVQLLHGDSDKPPSFSPVTAMYDRIFVAGKAGIDRYARKGVNIPTEKFVIVGRPQVDGVQPARGPIGELENRTVLYAPTWTGHFGDTDYCSLHLSEPIVQGLLDRGVTVVLRHHPYSTRNPASMKHLTRLGELLAADAARTGRAHRWGPDVQDGMTLFECFNLADALVADVSSVITDFLYSTKPFAVVAVADSGAAFLEDFPLARSSYVIESDLSNVGSALDDLLGPDPLAQARLDAESYYLGDAPSGEYADRFLEAVRACL